MLVPAELRSHILPCPARGQRQRRRDRKMSATEPWISPCRRIRLPPVRPTLSPAGSSPRSGSRFDFLEDSEVDEEITVAEEVAWAGLEDVPKVLPIALDDGHDRDALLEDFWGKIGYPGVATRPWERRSPAVSSVPRARSVSVIARF
jgi:hypothetical protein